MGELRSRVRLLVHRYLNGELTDNEFEIQVAKLLREFPFGLVYQNIGLIVWAMEAPYRLAPRPTTPLIVSPSLKPRADQFKRIWSLLDELESRITEHLIRWKNSMESINRGTDTLGKRDAPRENRVECCMVHGEYDILVKLQAKDLDELDLVTEEMRSSIPSIILAFTAMVAREYKGKI